MYPISFISSLPCSFFFVFDITQHNTTITQHKLIDLKMRSTLFLLNNLTKQLYTNFTLNALGNLIFLKEALDPVNTLVE
jgi:hypothetical protein